jgi:hypothetical protein
MRRALAACAICAGCGFAPQSVAGASGDARAIDAPPDAPPDAYVPPVSPRTLTIHAGLTSPISNIPICVVLTPAEIDYAQVMDPKTDLEFESPTLVGLFYDVEAWNPGGVSVVWVLVPQIPTTDIALTMKFGHAVGTEDKLDTWGGYEVVLHGAAPLADPSGNLYAPTGVNVTAAAGKAGQAIGFAGSGDERVTFANGIDLFDGWSQFTLELWIYPDYATFGSAAQFFANQGGGLNLGRMFPTAGAPEAQIDFHFTDSNDAYLNTPIEMQTWTHIAYVFNGTALRLFVNAELVGNPFVMAGMNNETLVASLAAFYLGANSAPFKGALDELEIDQRAHSVEWIHTQYLAMTRQLITFSGP